MNLLELLCRVQMKIDENNEWSFNDALFILRNDKMYLSDVDRKEIEVLLENNTADFKVDELGFISDIKLKISENRRCYEKD